VVHAITTTGAKVIYTAPYSPDLNPIELMFGQYKAALKRNTKLPWAQAHLLGLMSVKPRNARNYCRKCRVPGCEEIELAVDDTRRHVLATVAVVADLLRRSNDTKMIVVLKSEGMI
jgi:hypothetical protein